LGRYFHLIAGFLSGCTTGAVFFVSLNSGAGLASPQAAAFAAGFGAAACILCFFMDRCVAFSKGNTSTGLGGLSMLIYLIPVMGIFALITRGLVFGKLALVKTSVFGAVYLPFSGFIRPQMPEFFLILCVAALWITLFFIIALVFIKNYYISGADRETERTVFLFSLVFSVLTTSWITLTYPPTGDEPHYLAAASSIAHDADLDLVNNYEGARENRLLFIKPADYERLHTIRKNGKILPAHDLGLSIMLAPAVKLGGRYWVQFLINICAALLCLSVFLLLIKLGIPRNIAAASAMLSSVSAPLITGSSLALTEVPAAAITAFCLYVLVSPQKTRNTILFFLLISFLPWLHAKLALLSAAFFMAYCVMNSLRKSLFTPSFFSGIVMAAASLAGYLFLYGSVYGMAGPFGIKQLHENIYSDNPAEQLNTFVITAPHFFTSLFASLFDRDYGLFTSCPAFVLSLFGLALAIKRREIRIFSVFLPLIPYLVVFLFWKDWTGSMTPARQLIPIIPFFIFSAAYFASHTNVIRAYFFKLIIAASLLASWMMACLPPLRYYASKEKIYFFSHAKLGKQALWLLPPFMENTAAGFTVSLIYLLILSAVYLSLTKDRQLTD